MILKVARLGHPVLRRKARPIPVKKISSPAIQAFIEDLIQTMREYDGVGIAAPQVHVSAQIAVIEVNRNPRYPKAPKVPLQVLINPRIRLIGSGKPVGSVKVEDWEGCLSVAELRGRVPRWRSVLVEAYNAKGEPVRFRADGFHARVIQHEWDHLQGKVFLDRMRGFQTLTHLTEFSRYWAEHG